MVIRLASSYQRETSFGAIMKKNSYIFCVGCFVLSACGGGGTIHGEGTLAELSKSYEESGSNAHEVLKEYSSGNSIMVLKGKFKTSNSSNEDFYVFALTDDQQTTIDTFEGVVNFEVSDYTDFNGTEYYAYDTTGTNAKGQEISSKHLGFYNGDTDVGAVSAIIGGNQNLMSLGYKPGELPAGIQTYSKGDTRIIYRGDVETSYDMTTLIADFNTSLGSLLAETDNLYMSATDFTINMVTGEISGPAQVGDLSNSTDFVAAKLMGTFAGTYGDGVHGIIYQDADSASGAPAAGVFYALNNRLFE